MDIKNFLGKTQKIFFKKSEILKILKFQNSDFSKISEISIFLEIFEIVDFRKNIFWFFSRKFLISKNMSVFFKILYRSEISPGIQKSYLENCAGKINTRKIKKSSFYTKFWGNPSQSYQKWIIRGPAGVPH